MNKDTLDTLEPTARPELTPIGIDKDKKANIYSSPPYLIQVREDRHRQKFDRQEFNALIESLREVGQLQPGVCCWNDEDRLELVIGERRLRACTILKMEFQYLITDELDPLILEQMQLDENLQRSDLTWQEDIQAKARLHSILVERFGKAKPGMPGGQRLQDTADHLNTKMVTLQQDVLLATFLEVPEVASASNKTTAKKIVKRLIETVKRKEDLQTALKGQGAKVPELSEEDRAELKFKEREIEEKLISEGTKPEEAKKEAQKVVQKELKLKTQPTAIEQQLLYFSKKTLLGKMEEKLSLFEDSSFDIVCFDPPWGVDFDSVSRPSPGTKEYEDSWEQFWLNLSSWLTLIYSKMKEDSHLYMFFGIVSHNFVYNTLESVGFSTNRMPLIWYKKGAHVTRNPTIWPGRSYEPIAYARKGAKPLVKLGAEDVISTPAPTPSIKDIHPSAKHPQIYRELLLRSANPGDRVLDPMAGSGMFGVAAESLFKTHALDWTMIELDEDFRDLQLLNLMKGYESIAGEKPSEREPIQVTDMSTVKSYEELTPGSEAWKTYWSTHPEEQNDMLAWRQAAKK